MENSKPKPVRVAMIGCGGRAGVHAPVARESPDVEIVLWFDVDRKKAESISARYGGRVAESWEAVLADKSIEGVAICLPHQLHHRFGIEAACAGKHILMEIPIAASLQETDELIAAAEKAGVILLVLHSLRFWRSHQYVKQLLDSGALGQPFFARYHNEHYVPADYFARQRPHISAGYLTVESGVLHHGDVVRWWLGEVEAVTACGLMVEPVSKELGAFDHVTILYELAGGALGETTCSWVTKQCELNQMVRGSVSCTEGTVVLTWNDEVRIYSEKGMPAPNAFGAQPDLFAAGHSDEHFLMLHPAKAKKRGHSGTAAVEGPDGEIIHFAECIRGRKAMLVSPRDAKRALEMALAVRESARKKQRIELQPIRRMA